MGSRCWTPASSGFSPTHQRYWSYLDLLVENDWLLSQQGGTFLCQSATNHTSLRIAWEVQGGVLAKAFDFLHGVRVRASSLRAPTSRTTPIPFTYRGPDGAILSLDCKVKLMKEITPILLHFRLSAAFGKSLDFLHNPLQLHRKKRKRVEHH